MSIEFTIHVLMKTSTHGASFEAVASAAFGRCGKTLTSIMLLVTLFFATAGYAISLRDVIKPVADHIQGYETPGGSRSTVSNLILAGILLLVTPLTTLQSYTALKHASFLSMVAILILSLCVVYRTVECNLSASVPPLSQYVRFVPADFNAMMNALPVLISAYICHFNVLPVYAELQNPTECRARYLSRSTVVVASIFYMSIGLFGSLHGNCTGGTVNGNILLDFDDEDKLLMVGRVCLGITITLSFPLLVIPARDILSRWISAVTCSRGGWRVGASYKDDDTLEESLLQSEQSVFESDELGISSVENVNAINGNNRLTNATNSTKHHVYNGENDNCTTRIIVAVTFFWSSGFVAFLVENVDVIW
eukprot:CAMPEP_0172484446 /NCGR_PEP_ID=MMETSP1066-20121228/11913_1 /TAXON_ID=671091 /ORGANISM="Coscinodiscus wailesii, Strain CCMP2513" /LENGTH=364 /DNA_ID=CAMNT_0013248983 /DNA_START=194 /DNA_END=1285 /DNA_ORIENTATION=+